MKKNVFTKKRILFIVITAFIAIGIVSLTIGKDIFEGRQPGLLSFSVIHFSGYLFFLLMPVELGFIYYLAQHNVIILVLTAVATAIVAQFIDYAIGYLLSKEFINEIIGRRRYEKAEKSINEYGNLTIFLFNLLPLSSSIIVLVAGMVRYKLRHVILYSLLGLGIKYVVLAVIFV